MIINFNFIYIYVCIYFFIFYNFFLQKSIVARQKKALGKVTDDSIPIYHLTFGKRKEPSSYVQFSFSLRPSPEGNKKFVGQWTMNGKPYSEDKFCQNIL